MHAEGDGAPKQAYARLRKAIPKTWHPYLRALRKRVLRENFVPDEPYCHVYAFTQASLPRQRSIHEKTAALVAEGIAGDFVECGVLDGGTAALIAYAIRADDRRLHLFDAWQGLPQSTKEDGEAALKWVGDVVGSPKRVVSVLRKVGARMDRVVFHKGWYDDTLPGSDTGPVAFLHIDCDFYDPTKLVLETFMPRMVPGGWVQIDDYLSFQGCRLAVDEYLAKHPELTLTVDETPGGAIHMRIPASWSASGEGGRASA
ncbi:MAG: TylF/MycF/NovP-related O-methyltransferase [Pseudomonadota bacterium]